MIKVDWWLFIEIPLQMNRQTDNAKSRVAFVTENKDIAKAEDNLTCWSALQFNNLSPFVV